ncbi:putative cytochrome c biosynthesis ccmC-like mitochondrial protein [Capsicum annuum]|nr:putative cytochrome c biosynthesis ccmC-like mitochondrial protein [Capsicum annuum]KAF3669059.1 putative cytochrome c biosynthesis ccmC-like mitochondrial protein [Capsicum annuum]
MDQDMLSSYHAKGAAGGYAKDVLALNRVLKFLKTDVGDLEGRYLDLELLVLIFIILGCEEGERSYLSNQFEPVPISIHAGPINIPIIKSSVNWWNTLHQPGSINRSGTSIHVPMPIPILSNFANSPFSTRILFVLETHLHIPSFLESPLMEEIEAREGSIPTGCTPMGPSNKSIGIGFVSMESHHPYITN